MPSQDETLHEPTEPRKFLNYLMAGLGLGLGILAFLGPIWSEFLAWNGYPEAPLLVVLVAIGAIVLAHLSRFSSVLATLIIMLGAPLGVLGVLWNFLWALLPGGSRSNWQALSLSPEGLLLVLGPCLVCAVGVIFLGHRRRFRAGYWSGYIGLAALLVAPLTASILLSRDQPPVWPASDVGSPLGLLQTINVSEVAYEATYEKGFSPSLAALGEPIQGKESAGAAGLIDSHLASGEKSGYRFVYAPGPRNEKGQITSYTLTASPIKPETGNFYYTDQTGVIRMNKSAPATAADPPLAG